MFNHVYKCVVKSIKGILYSIIPLYHRILAKKVGRKKEIEVVFFAMSLPMWRYQYLYEALTKHPRFKTHIIVLPNIAYCIEQQQKDQEVLADFFQSQNIPFVLGRHTDGSYTDIFKTLSPDILFYPQPYSDCYPQKLSFRNFFDKLICYCPYAFWTSKGEWSYNLLMHNLAWKLFYPTVLHRKDAQDISHRRGRNMHIVGYPTADDFLFKQHKDLWKSQTKRKKRLIWAPHFSIFPGGYLQHSNFLWMADLMLELCEKYKEELQIIFKPHPRLFSELCRHKDWGADKTREYYDRWDSMENSQMEAGTFVDIFMTSDAMIHDCGSFSVEYHYSGNPVMFISTDYNSLLYDKNEFGKLAMNMHYMGKSREDIVTFIENVVLKGNDPMLKQRQDFRDNYLLPPNGKTVTENMLEVLLNSLNI